MIITPNTEELILAAAHNNAAWCAAVSGDGGFTAEAWTSPRRTPPSYPDAVTLTPDEEAWAGALTLVASRRPGLAVVGYESGDDLDTALGQGFTALGPLRVWIHAG